MPVSGPPHTSRSAEATSAGVASPTRIGRISNGAGSIACSMTRCISSECSPAKGRESTAAARASESRTCRSRATLASPSGVLQAEAGWIASPLKAMRCAGPTMTIRVGCPPFRVQGAKPVAATEPE